MEDILLLDAIERYVKGEMSAQEKTFFEEMRKNNPDVDQLVVEHTFFLQELDKHADIKAYKHSLYEVESKLAEEGIISKLQLKGKAKVVYLWKKYKRNVAVAASIAGLVSLVTTGLVVAYNNKVDNNNITELIGQIKKTEKKVDQLDNTIKANNTAFNPQAAAHADYRATGFLIDGRGYIITNAHVVNKMKNIYVENSKGEYYNAFTVYSDNTTDLALLKISDSIFKPLTTLPYSIKKTNAELGEQIFTLGYPRNEIVYGEGYLSAKSGNDGDSTAYQISVSANPGNSGGPVINKSGEIVGIITSKNSTADGVVFATKSKNIFKLLDAVKKGNDSLRIQLPNNFGLKGMDRVQQVKRMEEYVFMVIGN